MPLSATPGSSLRPRSVSELMDPALNRRRYPDFAPAPMNVTDAINAGSTVFGWGASSGAGPGTRGYTGSFGSQGQEEEGADYYNDATQQAQQPRFRTGRPASEVPGAVRRRTSQIRPLAPTFYAHGTESAGQTPGPIPPGTPFIAGDPQEDGLPNEELILPAEDGIHVIPLKDIKNLPKFGDGTAPVKDKGQERIRPHTKGLPPPVSGLAAFEKLNPDTPSAAMQETVKLMMNPNLPLPIRLPQIPTASHGAGVKPVPKYAYGTSPVRRHHRGEDTRAPLSRAGRTAGLSRFYGNNGQLDLERGARTARDPITGLSQTPTEREIADQLRMLSQKGEEFPGYSGEDEALLLHRYYQAKRSGDPDALAEAAGAVSAYKDRLNALRAQQQRQTDAPLAQQAGVKPGQSIASQVGAPAAVPPTPEGGLAPATLIPGLTGRTASMGQSRSMQTPYGSAGVTFAPRTASPTFNLSDTYDPKFGDKTVAAAESAQPSMPSEPEEMPEMPMLEGEDYANRPEGAVVQSPAQANQSALAMNQNLGRTASLSAGAGEIPKKSLMQQGAELASAPNRMIRDLYNAIPTNRQVKDFFFKPRPVTR